MQSEMKWYHGAIGIALAMVAVWFGVVRGNELTVVAKAEQIIDSQEKEFWDEEVVKMRAKAKEEGSKLYAVKKDTNTFRVIPYFPQKEIGMIFDAAFRNKLTTEQTYVLFGIRKAENGKAGREFGIIHPKCEQLMALSPHDTFSIQAGWCAQTIKKNWDRWVDAGQPDDFITFLGSKYCPADAENDPKNLNQHWVGNVKKWVEKVAVRE